MKTNQKNKGFIALMSAMVISILMLAITLSVGFSGFFTRFTISDSESKRRSLALAEACGDSALLEVSRGVYSTNEVINVGPSGADTCTIVSVTKDQPIAGQILIKTQAVINKAYTNLNIVTDRNTLTIISWEECATNSCL